jgi:hypothetical protein
MAPCFTSLSYKTARSSKFAVLVAQDCRAGSVRYGFGKAVNRYEQRLNISNQISTIHSGRRAPLWPAGASRVGCSAAGGRRTVAEVLDVAVHCGGDLRRGFCGGVVVGSGRWGVVAFGVWRSSVWWRRRRWVSRICGVAACLAATWAAVACYWVSVLVDGCCGLLPSLDAPLKIWLLPVGVGSPARWARCRDSRAGARRWG